MTTVTTRRPDEWRRQGTQGRCYHHNGQSYLSVTNALKHGTGAEWMAPAAAKFTANYIADNWLELRQYGIDHGKPALVNHIKSRYREEWDAAADLGTAVHTRIEQEILRPDLRDETPAAGTEPFIAQFRDFVDTCRVKWVAAELVVFNDTYRYAGTLDAIADVQLPSGGALAVIDFKTNKNIYPDAAIQLAAYRYAEFATLDADIQFRLTDVFFGNVVGLVVQLRPRSWNVYQVDLEAAHRYLPAILEAARFTVEEPTLLTKVGF